MSEYAALKTRLARGWNTWNTRSVLSHVLLPSGFALNLGVKEYSEGAYLKEALIGRTGEGEEQIHPGPRAYDDSYTELLLTWHGVQLLVQSGLDEVGELVLLVTPQSTHRKAPLLVLESGLLWNRDGYVTRDEGTLIAHLPAGDLPVYATAQHVADPYVAMQSPYLAFALTQPVGISTGLPRTVEAIRQIIAAGKARYETSAHTYGPLAETYKAMQTCLAWDTVYDPLHNRVITPVSRSWNIAWGGYNLFCWDTYFAGYLAGLDHKDLAYANMIEMTREKTATGFVPNYAAPENRKSHDRSEPPVGAYIALQLYRRFGNRWLLDELFDDLLEWNRWWIAHRQSTLEGLLAWGSDPYEPISDGYWETHGVNERYGGSLESGLDNSPMYDDIPFDAERHQLCLADVGLNSLYVLDCRALTEIATILGRPEAEELRNRADTFAHCLQALWDDDTGLFLNRRTDTGAFSHRLSPTNFYPLLACVATQAQAERMIREHFYNADEFWGEWLLPSIARNDPAYPDQDYWRGRIWAPMNFLVYLGLRQYDLPQARRDLVAKSQALLLKEWHSHGHVHENYDGDTGEGCNRGNSDRFYHWGGLLGLIAFLDAGYLA